MKKKPRIVKRILSVALAAALVTTSVQIAAIPSHVVLAAPGNIETGVPLGDTNVKDQNVLTFYKIIANAVFCAGNKEAENQEEAKQVLEYIGMHTAEDVLTRYKNNAVYTRAVAGTFLSEYTGKIDFGNMKVSSIEGIGWAQKASEIDLSQVTFSTGAEIKVVPKGEFKNCMGLKKIVLPATVTTIDANAFENCSSLTTLGIGAANDNVVDLSKVTTVGTTAFGNCSAIKTIEFGKYSTRSTKLELKGQAFVNCTSLQKVEIPIQDALKMGTGAFENCSGLMEVGLEEGLQYIGNSVFKGVGADTADGDAAKFYVIGEETKDYSCLPKTITYIGDNAFQESFIKKMDLSSCTKLTKINKSAFTGADFQYGDDIDLSNLTDDQRENLYKEYTIVLPESLTSIGEEAFHKCGITYIDIPKSCTDIGKSAFSESYLIGMKLPNTITTIKEGTFYRCHYLYGTKIEIPADAKLQTIETFAFSECWKLYTTSFLKNLKNLKTIGEKAFSACYVYNILGTNYITNTWGEREVYSGLKEVILPDCVTELGKGAFSNNYYMQTVTLGSGIKNIPELCFGNDSKDKNSGARLEKVIVSDKLETIGDNAFANQYKLTTLGTKTKLEEGTVQFADGLVSIGDNAFLNCGKSYDSASMTAVHIMVLPENVKTTYSDGDYEFIVVKNGEQKSEHIFVAPSAIVDPTTVTDTESYEDYYVVAQRKYYDPNDVVSALDANKTNIFVGDVYDTTQTAYANRLLGTGSIFGTKYLAKGSSVSLTPGSGMVGAYMPPVLKELYTEENNTNQKSVTLAYVFGMKKLVIPDSLKEDNIGEAAFMNCCRLENVRLPKALTEIKKDTFNGCGGEEVNILDRSEKAKYYDYYGLRTINIPNTVTSIGDSAFMNCTNLILANPQGVGSSFGTGIQSIGNSAFSGCLSLDEVVFPSSLLSIGASAFAKCALIDNTNREIPYENSTKKVSYKVNYSRYGTKEVKKGLRTVDFVRASKLKEIGNNAFEQTNITQFDISKTKVTAIKTGLLKQCTFLQNVTFSDLTESMAAEVMKDDLYLAQLTAPISSTMQGNTVSGLYGTVGGRVSTYPALILRQPDGEVQPLPIDRDYELKINAVNEKTLYQGSTPTISVIDGSKEHEIYSVKDGVVVTNEYRGLSANVTKDAKGTYHFVVNGKEYIDKESPVTLRVKFTTGLQILDSSSFWQSAQQIDYKVSVTDVVTEKVSVTANGDNSVTQNPNMFVEENGEKVLYIPSGGQAATSGVTLTATVEPAETTQGYTWESSDPALVDFVEGTDSFKDGKAVIKIKRADISSNGTAFITIKSGSKSDRITVVCQTSASGFDTVKTKGDNLPDNLVTSANNPYVLPNGNGGKDQLDIKLRYPAGTDPASEEQLIFTSSNPDVISVDQMGNLTTKQASDEIVVITVTGRASGISKTFYFMVTDDQNVKPSAIEIIGGNTVNVGESIHLDVKVKPINAGNKEVEWKVNSGAQVASVDEQGNVTGLKKGTAKIVAISKENSNVKSSEFMITVHAPAKSIQILDAPITLEEGKSYTINKTTNASLTSGYVVTPNDTEDKVEWTTSNPGVASITTSGTRLTIKAESTGTAVLTATATSGVSASINVTIVPKKVNVTGISITKVVTLNVGQTHTLTPTVLPANANEAVTYTYSTNNAKVATVDANGVIRAVGPGTATITAKTNTNRYAGCTVTVKQPAKSIRIYLNKPNVKKVYMAKGQTLSIKAEKNPLTSTDTLSYKTNKKKVAVVSASGMITAKKKGTAKITIQASSGKKATITVVVSKKEVKAKKVKVKGPSTMKRKQTKKLTVSLVKAKSTDTISFSSSNPAIASVDAYGNVKAIKKGKVKITVQASSGKKAVKKIKIK